MSFARLACLSLITISSMVAGFFPHGPGPIGGLHSPCVSSVQCTGVAVCVQAQCECPAPLYRAIGGACQVVTYNTLQAVPAVRTTVVHAYPGNPCGPSLACVGGSSCLSGTCGCQPGFVVSGTSCVVGGPAFPAFPAPIAPGFGGHHGGFGGHIGGFGGHIGGFGGHLGGFGGHFPAAPLAPLGAVGFGGCGGGCFGGQVCVASVCQCPNGYVAKAGACGPPVPVVQVGPGGPCLAGEECTGGSVCQGGICCCPDGLIQIGAMCVLPPPPPPPPVIIQTVTVAVGHPCLPTSTCVAGASCLLGACRCGAGFAHAGPSCVRKCK